MKLPLDDAILGCLVGGAIGDAAGAAFESTGRLPEAAAFDGRHWRLTDDTQLTLATCEALTEAGRPEPASIAAAMLRWFRERRLSGLGASTLKALRDLDVGAHWALSGRKGERAAGNGAAMRIAPLAFCLDPHEDEARRLIRDVCRITHHDDEAYCGALAVTMAVRGSLDGRFSLAAIASNLPRSEVRERISRYVILPPSVGLAQAAAMHGASGFVAESVPLALFAASRADELGFVEMLKQTIAVGGDADTNASIACQIAGTAVGLRGLPKALLLMLPQPEMVLDVADEFADWLTRTSRGSS